MAERNHGTEQTFFVVRFKAPLIDSPHRLTDALRQAPVTDHRLSQVHRGEAEFAEPGFTFAALTFLRASSNLGVSIREVAGHQHFPQAHEHSAQVSLFDAAATEQPCGMAGVVRRQGGEQNQLGSALRTGPYSAPGTSDRRQGCG
jgi:hypothetical protein